MPKFHVTVFVKRRKTILDPEGKAIEHALHSLEYYSCNHVRVGKIIEFQIEEGNESKAKEVVNSACMKLLSNPIMEDYTYTIEQEQVNS